MVYMVDLCFMALILYKQCDKYVRQIIITQFHLQASLYITSNHAMLKLAIYVNLLLFLMCMSHTHTHTH